MYVDECGDHVMLPQLGTPQQRYLSLTGVWITRDEMVNQIRPEMEKLKRDHFDYDADESLILHRNDIVRRSGKFAVLRDPVRRAQFDQDLLSCLSRWHFWVVTVVIDKQSHYKQHYRSLRHP